MTDEDLKIMEIRVKNLMLSKQIIIQALIVIIGGLIGLGFMSSGTLRNSLLVFGLFYVLVLIKNFSSVCGEIEGYLYKNKRK